MIHVIVFEDGGHDRFYPLSLTRPLWELRCGIHSFRDRISFWCGRTFPAGDFSLHFFTRDCLVPAWRERYPEISFNDYSVFAEPGEFIFINATLFPESIGSLPDTGTVLMCEGAPLFARIRIGKPVKTGSISEIIMSSPVTQLEGGSLKFVRYIWDLVALNPEKIEQDIRNLGQTASVRKDVTVVGNPDLFFCDEDVRIDPFVVVDVTGGPVYIRKGTVIHPFTRIEGPAYIGRDCILLGAKVREGCSIGDVCRVGGEVEESIFHGYSNKYHDGFIGHSYVGEWVNMGAMTTCSDLKNNYSPVVVTMPWGKQNTGMSKLGCFIGDCARTSIGTLINTGAVFGTGTMVLQSGGLTPHHVPSFRWYIDGTVMTRDWLDDFIITCRRAMSRRDIEFSPEMERMYRDLFAVTG